ncbi:hypothetical protein [Desertivirga arenae]|uniref:hypothetical protein n=1 Tax=Desertivirga arenae TaxID=2810309 RepID=UPI001A96F72E|nr:hypothetical protein [Pedobacter sp. SYSU D00823]
MLRKPAFATTVVNLYIIVFLIVLEINISHALQLGMLYFSPVISLWMFYTIISGSGFRPPHKQIV